MGLFIEFYEFKKPWKLLSKTINMLNNLQKTNIFGMLPKILLKVYVHSSL